MKNDALIAIGIGVGALVGAAAAALLSTQRTARRAMTLQGGNIRLTARPADVVARARTAAAAAMRN